MGLRYPSALLPKSRMTSLPMHVCEDPFSELDPPSCVSGGHSDSRQGVNRPTHTAWRLVRCSGLRWSAAQSSSFLIRSTASLPLLRPLPSIGSSRNPRDGTRSPGGTRQRPSSPQGGRVAAASLPVWVPAGPSVPPRSGLAGLSSSSCGPPTSRDSGRSWGPGTPGSPLGRTGFRLYPGSTGTFGPQTPHHGPFSRGRPRGTPSCLPQPLGRRQT